LCLSALATKPGVHFASKSKKKGNAERKIIKIEWRKDVLPCGSSDLAKIVKPPGGARRTRRHSRGPGQNAAPMN